MTRTGLLQKNIAHLKVVKNVKHLNTYVTFKEIPVITPWQNQVVCCGFRIIEVIQLTTLLLAVNYTESCILC